MPIKTFSLKDETIETIYRLAKTTVRTQGAIVDIAVADLASKIVAEDGAIDLPVDSSPPPTRRSRAKAPAQISGVRKGAPRQ
jgi:predicted RecB family endonuclease